ncbi:hypothetical protein [Sphingopyxis sp. NFH-91]|uniref:hypothetical protein n=1 Tax=Sphingopyxis sp. NFH-91 TaxID=2744457 RepID=UPI001F39DAE4|nr:hypothetical protein [Sphingopyxis sp. NFH-91]
MDEPNADVALLTPVPSEHLISGEATCQQHGYVTYGTDAVDAMMLFVQQIGDDATADVLFYASGTPVSGVPRATYRARFERYLGAKSDGTAPAKEAAFRPPTTAPDGRWQSFYVVSNLTRLAVPIEIRNLTKLSSTAKLKSNFVPRGPLVIETPF